MAIVQQPIIQPQPSRQNRRVVSRLEVEVQQVLRMGVDQQHLIDGPAHHRRQVVRPVEKGEELFFRYSDYAQERFGLNGQ